MARDQRRRNLAPASRAPFGRTRRDAALAILGGVLATMTGCAEIVGISDTRVEDGRVPAGGGGGSAGESAEDGGVPAASGARPVPGTAGDVSGGSEAPGVSGGVPSRGGDGGAVSGAGERGGAQAAGGTGALTGGALVTGGFPEPPGGAGGGATTAGVAGGLAGNPGVTGGVPEPPSGGGGAANTGGAGTLGGSPSATGGVPASSGGTGGGSGEPVPIGAAGTTAGAAGGEAGGDDAGGVGGGAPGGAPPACSAGGAAGAAPVCTPACPPDRPTCVADQCVVRGPTMILVERLPASDSFYIDSTEVTVRQYLDFLAATGDEVGCQPSECRWNTSFAPGPGEVTSVSDLPMHYVDWCDATAYCAWAGKRLCGRIGGGDLSPDGANDYDLSEWLAACGGPNYFWHPSLDASGEPAVECNDWTWSRAPAGSTCEGSYSGLFDMQGNVNEWIDACAGTAGATDSCETLGGDAMGSAAGICYARDPLRRDSRYSFFGFRCCASTR